MPLLSKKIHQFLEFIILHLGYDKIIAISKATQKCIPMKSQVVYPGIDYNIWKPHPKINHKGFIIGFYGRPGVSKGLEYLIKAMPMIIKEIPKAELHAIVSNNSTYSLEYEKIMDLIIKLDMQDHITIYDPIPYKKLPDWLSHIDCVVVPSLTEGFGYCVAETCALGIPIVATKVGSIPEIISGKYRLVVAGSSMAIYNGVKSIYNRRALYKSPKKFKDRDCCDAYRNIYRNMTNVPNVPRN